MMIDPFSINVGVAGLVELAARTLSIIGKYAHDAKHGQETAQELLRELGVLHTNLRHLNNLLQTDGQAMGYFDDTSVLVSSVHACKNKLNFLHDKLSQDVIGKRSSANMLVWPLKAKEHMQSISELRIFGQWIQMALTIDGCALLSKTSREVLDVMKSQLQSFQMLDSIDRRIASTATLIDHQSKTLKGNQADREREKISEWLSTVNYQQLHSSIRRPRVLGTGQWLLEDIRFKSWRDLISPKERTLCCYGIQGSGKSILASLVIDHLKDRNAQQGGFLAYYYFDYQDSASHSLEVVLRSLLKQLVLHKDDIPESVLNLFQKMETQQRMPHIEDLEQVLVQVINCIGNVFFVLDALDECDDRDRKRLLDILGRLQLDVCVRVFLTGRLNVLDTIKRAFPNSQFIEVNASESDLQKYVTARIAEDYYADIIDENLEGQIIEKVTTAARKM